MIRGMFTHIHVSRSPHYAVNHLTGDATRRASPDARCPPPHTVWLSSGVPCLPAERCGPQPNGDCDFAVVLALQRASIMVSATPLCFCAMQKHLTIKIKRRSRTWVVILSGR